MERMEIMKDSYNPIVCVVHRTFMKDLDDVFKGILERLYISECNVVYKRYRIDVGDYVTFIFIHGNPYYLYRLRYELFNTDSYDATKYLRTTAINKNASEILDIYLFCDKMVELLKTINGGNMDEGIDD